MNTTKTPIIFIMFLIGSLFIVNLNAESATKSATKSTTKITKADLALKKYPVKGKLRKILQTNLDFFADGVGVDPVAKVPYDTIYVDKKTHKISVPDKFVNTTEIGEYLSILVLLGKYGSQENKHLFLDRIHFVLEQLWNAPHWEGLQYWPYDINSDGTLTPGDDGRTVPVVDNGNLCFALAGVIGAYMESGEPIKKEICAIAQEILDRQITGWQKLYSSKTKLLYAGWDPVEDKALTYFIDRKANESRLGTIWSILITSKTKNPVPLDAWNGMALFTTDYKPTSQTCEMTWDGTVFQALLPAIYVKEKLLIPDYSIVRNFINGQHDFVNVHKIPSLMSASSSVDDGYASFGVPDLAETCVIAHNTPPPPESDTGTPHASALTYLIDKNMAESLLINLKENYPQIETPYGWYDAINAKGETCSKILSLDQGMFVLALFGDETADYVEKYLHKKNLYDLITKIYSLYIPNKQSKNNNNGHSKHEI